MKISVCLASYNGGKFIFEQVNTIICQLDEGDELIISDDSSMDKTRSISDSFRRMNYVRTNP